MRLPARLPAAMRCSCSCTSLQRAAATRLTIPRAGVQQQRPPRPRPECSGPEGAGAGAAAEGGLSGTGRVGPYIARRQAEAQALGGLAAYRLHACRIGPRCCRPHAMMPAVCSVHAIRPMRHALRTVPCVHFVALALCTQHSVTAGAAAAWHACASMHLAAPRL